MSHVNVSLFLVCEYEAQVLPQHQNFSCYAPGRNQKVVPCIVTTKKFLVDAVKLQP